MVGLLCLWGYDWVFSADEFWLYALTLEVKKVLGLLSIYCHSGSVWLSGNTLEKHPNTAAMICVSWFSMYLEVGRKRV